MFWARRHAFNTFNVVSDRAQRHNLLDSFQVAFGADLFGITVTRIRGTITWSLSGPNLPPQQIMEVSAGIRLDEEAGNPPLDVDQIARLAYNDPHVDWMWQRNSAIFSPSDVAIAAGISPAQTWDIDIKSQRRMDELGQSLFLFIGLPTQNASTTAICQYDLHVLCKRP